MFDGVLGHKVRCPVGGSYRQESHLGHFPQPYTDTGEVEQAVEELRQEQGILAIVHRPEDCVRPGVGLAWEAAADERVVEGGRLLHGRKNVK